MHAIKLQPTPIHPSQPQRLVVIGDDDLRTVARPWLSGLDVAVDFLARAEELAQIPHDDIIGVVMLGEPSTLSPGEDVRRLRWLLDKRSRKDLLPMWLKEPVSVPTLAGSAQVELRDVSNCFNLNSIAINTSGTDADPNAIAVYEKLLTALGTTETDAERLESAETRESISA